MKKKNWESNRSWFDPRNVLCQLFSHGQILQLYYASVMFTFKIEWGLRWDAAREVPPSSLRHMLDVRLLPFGPPGTARAWAGVRHVQARSRGCESSTLSSKCSNSLPGRPWVHYYRLPSPLPWSVLQRENCPWRLAKMCVGGVWTEHGRLPWGVHICAYGPLTIQNRVGRVEIEKEGPELHLYSCPESFPYEGWACFLSFPSWW